MKETTGHSAGEIPEVKHLPEVPWTGPKYSFEGMEGSTYYLDCGR